MIISLGCIGVYVLLVGIASFAEKSLAENLDAFQLDAAVRTGALLLAVPVALGVHGFSFPGLASLLAGFGIGVLAGVGAVFYFLTLTYLPAWLAGCLANTYILVTAFLSITILGESITIARVLGFVFTVAGVAVLSYHRHQPQAKGPKPRARRLRHLALMLPYIVLLGVAAFLEKPALKHLDALQLNMLVALGMSTVAAVAVTVRDRHMSLSPPALKGAGLGVMIGGATISYYVGLAHLPVSVAATLANTYVLVTVVLSTVVWHQAVTASKVGGVLVILTGVALLTLRIHF